jgi:hypothetical protein
MDSELQRKRNCNASPIDFHDPAQARAWEDEIIKCRPWRPQFFAAFAEILNKHFERPFTLLEFGSGQAIWRNSF